MAFCLRKTNHLNCLCGYNMLADDKIIYDSIKFSNVLRKLRLTSLIIILTTLIFTT